jgi:hypothetical protein
VALPVETVSVLLPAPATEAGLKLPLAPEGSPLTLNVTVPVKPFCAATVVVYVVELPATTDCDAGVAEMVKSGEGGALDVKTTSSYQV